MRESMKENDSSAERVSTVMVTVMELARASRHGEPEFAGEILGAAQDDGESVEGIDAEIGQQADFGEDLGAQEVCFIDEQHGMDVGRVVEIQDMLLDVAEHGGATIVGLQAEQDRQVGIELDSADRRVAEVEGAVEAGGQALLQEAQQAALAVPGLPVMAPMPRVSTSS